MKARQKETVAETLLNEFNRPDLVEFLKKE
jgi:hypothetical protein